MTKITFIRHGETYANTNKIYSNITDYPLDETGVANVEKTAHKLKNEVFNVFLYGKRKRVEQTACAILKELKHLPEKIIQTSIIDEILFGDFEGLTANEATEKYPSEWEDYMRDWENFTFPQGTNIKEFCEKYKEFIFDVIKEYKNKNIAIVGHHGCISACKIALENKSISAFVELDLPNANCIIVNV